jgi:two-component system sensor histidine kinase/response regulator
LSLARAVLRHASRMVRILVADDSESSLAFVTSCAGAAGYDTVRASTGEAALALFEPEDLHVVLLDVLMPGVGGIETCRRMRAHPMGHQLPIVLMTGLDEPWVVEDAIAAGADDVLMKPIRRTELLVRIRSLLRTYDLLRRERIARDLVEWQNQQLEQLSRQKDELSGFIFHDLKSPLASITFTLQNLMAETGSDAMRESLRSCLNATDTVGRMILNVLDLNGHHQLRAIPEPIDIADVVDRLGRTFSSRLAIRELTLVGPRSPVALRADRELLRRILDNLVDNAIRYSPRGSAIEIATDTVDGGTELRVTDRGPGVPPEHRYRIFEPFVQLSGEVPPRILPRGARGPRRSHLGGERRSIGRRVLRLVPRRGVTCSRIATSSRACRPACWPPRSTRSPCTRTRPPASSSDCLASNASVSPCRSCSG